MSRVLHLSPISETLKIIRREKGLFYIDAAYHPKHDVHFNTTIKIVDEELSLLEQDSKNFAILYQRVHALPNAPDNTGYCAHIHGTPQKYNNTHEGIFEDFCNEILATRFLRQNGYSDIRLLPQNLGCKVPDLSGEKDGVVTLFEVKTKNRSSVEEAASLYDSNHPGTVRLLNNSHDPSPMQNWLRKVLAETELKAKEYNAKMKTSSPYHLIAIWDPHPSIETTTLSDIMPPETHALFTQIQGY